MPTDSEITEAAFEAAETNVGPTATPWFVSDFGSRATGLDHEDSDHDVFCVYDQAAYNHKLGTNVEAFNDSVNGIDVQGHSTVKFVRSIADADPMCVESLHSPRRYYVDDSVSDVVALLEDEVEHRMERVGLFYHYRSFAGSQYRQYIENGNEPTYHRWAQTCRAALSATYIHQTGDTPPMDANTLLGACHDWLDVEAVDAIQRAFNEKADGNGDDEYTATGPIDEWIRAVLNTDMDHDRYDYNGIDHIASKALIAAVGSQVE